MDTEARLIAYRHTHLAYDLLTEIYRAARGPQSEKHKRKAAGWHKRNRSRGRGITVNSGQRARIEKQAFVIENPYDTSI